MNSRSLEPLSPNLPTSPSHRMLEALDDVVPVALICGITQDSFAHLQYFFYAATTINAIVWVFVPISGYIPITLSFISAILFAYPQSISSVENQRPRVPESIPDEAERYGTYNILCPTYTSKSPSFASKESRAWEPRNRLVIKNIKQARLDVLSIQEITPVIFAELNQSLSDASLVGEYKGHGTENQHLKDDGVAIFYNSHKFELLQKENISSGLTQRICLFIDLRNRANNRVTRFASFHLDGTPEHLEVGLKQLEKILTSLPANGIDRYVLAGDFNTEMGPSHPNPRKTKVQEDGYYRIVCRDETEVGTGARLDDVFVKQSQGENQPILSPLGIYDQPAGSDHHLTGCHVDPV